MIIRLYEVKAFLRLSVVVHRTLLYKEKIYKWYIKFEIISMISQMNIFSTVI